MFDLDLGRINIGLYIFKKKKRLVMLGKFFMGHGLNWGLAIDKVGLDGAGEWGGGGLLGGRALDEYYVHNK